MKNLRIFFFNHPFHPDQLKAHFNHLRLVLITEPHPKTFDLVRNWCHQDPDYLAFQKYLKALFPEFEYYPSLHTTLRFSKMWHHPHETITPSDIHRISELLPSCLYLRPVIEFIRPHIRDHQLLWRFNLIPWAEIFCESIWFWLFHTNRNLQILGLWR